MQLILEAGNSDINIKEKMTTVEESMEKLMNGVTEIEKTSGKENLSNLDTEITLNGDAIQKNTEDVPAPLCKDISENRNSEKKKPSNSNHENKIGCANRSIFEDVLSPVIEDFSGNDIPETSHSGSENSFIVDKSTEIHKHHETGDNGEPKNELKEVLIPSSENVLEDINLEKEKTPYLDDESNSNIEVVQKSVLEKVPMPHCENIRETSKLETDEPASSNGESRVNIIEISDKNFNKHKKCANENKADDRQKMSYQTKSVNDDTKLKESTVELCQNMEEQNIIKNNDSSTETQNKIKIKDSDTVDIKPESSDGVENQTQDRCCIEVNECNFEKVSNEIVNNLISESEKLPDNKAKDMPSTDCSDTEVSTEMSANTKSDVKKDDMECNEVIRITELNPTMECDRNNLHFNERVSSENALDNKEPNDTTTKKDNVDNNRFENDSTTEAPEKVMADINEPREEKDTSIVTDSTVVETMDTSEENEISKKIIIDEAVEDNQSISDFNNKNESVEKENSASDALSITYNPCKDVNSDIEELKENDIDQKAKTTATTASSKVANKPTPVVKLSNTLNILSDDEDDPPKTQEIQAASSIPNDKKQCISIEDDDDVMLIEDTPRHDKLESISSESTVNNTVDLKPDSDKHEEKISNVVDIMKPDFNDVKESSEPESKMDDSLQIKEKIAQAPNEEIKKEQPLLPKEIFKSYKKNLTEMTRDDLEEFCILKIVESIIDRSSLNEIKTKLKTMAQTIEEYKKKAMMLTKQNRDLQVVLKSIQEEQKKGGDSPIVPLKITRSVGMQVLMTDKNARRKVMPMPNPGQSANVNNRPARNINQSPRQQTPVNALNQQIPVPRLVPATNNSVANKAPPSQVAATRNPTKPTSAVPNGVRNSPLAPKPAEKRSRPQSITVDLTDDEPPPKVPAPPVRVVSSQNLLTPRAQMASNTLTNPRKVYIPIGSNQSPNVRPGQTIMLKNMPNTSGPRPRGTAPMSARVPSPNQIRMSRVQGRHPAPLPDAVKQYQPPNWKALPPAPDLKLSKVENGIVISWKIDGYQEDSYEEIASYQLYAYQETSSPPNTSLWKKIGDVKALPLPMACTLTQFMAGYKYYFAVRAVDIRSRLGPFSLPGSILLLNKM